jgi:hypothetical protein
VFLLNSRLDLFTAAPSGFHPTGAPLLPKLRGHFAEFLNESFPEHLRILSSPTCVGLRYGHLFSPRGFSWQCEIRNFGTDDFPRHHSPAYRKDGFAYPFGLTAWTRTSSRAIPYPPASPHRTNENRWYRNINLLSIAYAFRPQLRSRLTLSGRTFLRKP